MSGSVVAAGDTNASMTSSRDGRVPVNVTPARANPAPSAAVIDEGFENVPGLTANGWLSANHSSPLGASTWAQCGGTAIPPAFDGASTACALVNFNSTTGAGTISNWLVTKEITFTAGMTGSFYTRTSATAPFSDRLEVRVCSSGDCTNFGTGATDVGNYTTTLLTINPNLQSGPDPTGVNGYPDAWTQFTIPNLPTSGTGRIAFRYFVTSGGPDGSNSNIIGLDRLVVNSGGGGPAAPTVAKAFAPTSILEGANSTLTITLSNSNATAATLSAALTDTFPAGLTTAATPNASTTCTGGTGVTTTSGSVTLASGAAIPASGSCTIKVDVTSATAGSYPNTIAAGALQTDQGNNAAAGSATLTVTSPGGGGDLVCSGPVNHNVLETLNGTYVNWITNTFQDDTTLAGYHVNPYATGGKFAFFWGSNTKNAGVASSTTGTTWLVLQPGDAIGPTSTFSRGTGNATNWITAAGVDGYFGFSMDCSTLSPAPASGTCYGYAHISAGPTTGFPAKIIDYCYNKAGNAITIVGGGTGGAPSVTKSFNPTQVATNADSTATITLLNPNAGVATLTANLVDTLPAGLVATAASTTCGGTVAFTANSVTLPTGSTIPAGSCTITATVHSAAEGSYENKILAGGLKTDLGDNAADASATLTVSNTLPFPQPYCSVAFGSAVEPITKVTFTGIANPSPAAVNGSPALENFLSVAGGAVSRGGFYTMDVEGNTDGDFTNKLKVFIDWNQNGTFDANEGYSLSDLVSSTGTDGKKATGDIAVPTDALLGPTRMRVIKKFNAAADACNTGGSGYGQAEDYTITVDSNPLPQPIADVSPGSFSMTAQEGASATDTLTVSNSGPGRLTFNILRALPERGTATYAKATNRRVNDATKLALSGELPVIDAISLLESTKGDIRRGDAPMASDPLCEAGTPGLIMHDHDGAPDNGYGWNASAGAEARIVDKFTPSSYPASFSTACLTLLTNGGLTSAAVKIKVYADDGTGGGPGTELGSVNATANNIGASLVKQFQAFDISSMNLSIASGSVYIGVEWDATVSTALFLAVDETTPTSAGGYQYTTDWEPIVDTRPNYKSMYIRAIEASAGPPGKGCDSPSNIPWLSATPASGTLNGVGEADVTVKANAAGLAVGTYEAVLCVNTNDPAHPRFEIPVSFEVTPNVANDTIFKDGFDGAPPTDPDVVTGTINLPVQADGDGSTLDFVTGVWGTYDGSQQNINLYDYGDGTLTVYWYGDMASVDVGGVVDGGGVEFAVLQPGDTVGPSSTISAASLKLANWIGGVNGYIGVAFENSQTGELNYGYIHLTTTSPLGFPAQALEYAYNKAGNAITIPQP